tara:strand:- start:13167 stop:13769 length:603 start_codon:yes stop_codon:yes gene_type:complete
MIGLSEQFKVTQFYSHLIAVFSAIIVTGYAGARPSMTKLLSIFRHADAQQHPRFSDYERPLSASGVADAEAMLGYLEASLPPIDKVFCSDSVRTLETLEIFNRALALTPEQIISDSSLYLASTAELIASVEALSNEWQHAALVGHNPGLTALCNFYTGDALRELPTASHYAIAFETDDWTASDHSTGVLQSFTVPQQFKS